MNSLAWSWNDFWEWWGGIEDVERKVEILKQINADFVRGVSFEVQVEMFMPAPLEFIHNIRSIIKPETFEFIVRERHKQLRKIKRR